MTTFVFGSGGHAKVIIDALLCCSVGRILAVCDYSDETDILGVPLIRSTKISSYLGSEDTFHLGMGDILFRQKAKDVAKQVGLKPISIIHPKANVSKFATIGAGAFIGPLSHVGVNCRIGEHTIINTGAIVEHDCFVADFCHLAPSAILLGGVNVHSNSFIGANSVVLPRQTVNSNSCIGANSLVNIDIPYASRAFGSPIRLQN